MAPGYRASGQMLIMGLAFNFLESNRWNGLATAEKFSLMQGPRPFNGATFVRALVASWPTKNRWITLYHLFDEVGDQRLFKTLPGG